MLIRPAPATPVWESGHNRAQFIHLLLHNEKLQRVIDTITSKVVLILGRFSVLERKQVLDALRTGHEVAALQPAARAASGKAGGNLRSR
jgi:hypothetical protein